MRPNEPDQPDPTQPKFGPWGPNLTQNWVQIGFIWVYQVHYRTEPEFEPNPDQLDPFLTLRANRTRLNPNFGSKIGFNPKKRVGFGRTSLHPHAQDLIKGF